jgi:hypothetical protein
MLPAGSPYTWQAFASHQQGYIESLLLRTRDSRLHPSTSADRSMGPHSISLPPHNHWSSGESQTSIGNKLHRFTGPISLACDQYVQYFLEGINLSVLNRPRWGLQPWRCRLSTSLSHPSQPTVLRFPLKVMSGLQLNILKYKPDLKSRCVVVTYISRVVFVPLGFYQILWLCLAVLMTYNYD